MPRACWAASLGNCSDTLSGEHTVSKGLFIDDTVSVQGLSWCKDEPKTIGLNSLTRKILCTHHNSALSQVDDAAIAAFNAYREAVRLTGIREKIKERRWTVLHLLVDGEALERWFLKTLINITLGGQHKIGPKSDTPGEPSPDLVEIAFGQRKFVANAGLYNTAEIGETINSEDKVSIAPFFDSENQYVLGGTFLFRGFRFLLYLAEVGFDGKLTLTHQGGGQSSEFQKPIRHIRQMKFTVGPTRRYVSHTIDFDWC